MDPPATIHYVNRMAQLRYLSPFYAVRIFISGIDRLSESKDVALLLRKGADNHGWVVLNLDQVADAREIDYSLYAMEQSLEALGVDEEAFGGEEQALQTLELFMDRLSAERSISDEENARAVVTAVSGVVRAARSPRIEGDDAVDDLARLVKGVFGVARAVTVVLFCIIRAARSPQAAVEELARAARSPQAAVEELARAAHSRGVKGDDTMVGLARAALGEVRAARARPVVLDSHLLLQVASPGAVAELLRATPLRTHGVWSTVRVLNVRGVARLSDVGTVEYEGQRCCAAGWRVPQLKRLAQARRFDSHMILLNHKLKLAFNRSLVREDGSVDFSELETVGEQVEKIVRLCSDEIEMFQSEVATLPDVLCQIVAAADVRTSPQQAKMVRKHANEAMLIIRSIRAQQVQL